MERGGRELFLAADVSQLLKQNNNNAVILRPQWLPLATMAFFGLLRAIRAAALNHTTKCYTHHIQQPTIAHRQAQLHVPSPIGAAGLLFATRVAVDEKGS